MVANEVKELAKETAKATEDISQKIEAIQGDTKGAVEAIGEIGTIINQINDISNTIASAVEEQTVTTNEIGRNVAEAAKGTNEIAKNISGVAEAAQSTTAGTRRHREGARALSQMAAQLQTLVGRIHGLKRAADAADRRRSAASAGRLTKGSCIHEGDGCGRLAGRPADSCQDLERTRFRGVAGGQRQRGAGLIAGQGDQLSLILVDWNMPGMNGLDFVRQVRCDPAMASVVLVMVTTETEIEQMVTALDGRGQRVRHEAFHQGDHHG